MFPADNFESHPPIVFPIILYPMHKGQPDSILPGHVRSWWEALCAAHGTGDFPHSFYAFIMLQSARANSVFSLHPGKKAPFTPPHSLSHSVLAATNVPELIRSSFASVVPFSFRPPFLPSSSSSAPISKLFPLALLLPSSFRKEAKTGYGVVVALEPFRAAERKAKLLSIAASGRRNLGLMRRTCKVAKVVGRRRRKQPSILPHLYHSGTNCTRSTFESQPNHLV